MRKTLAFGLLIFILAGCAPAAPLEVPSPSPTRDATLRPYPTSTHSATPLPTDYVTPTPSPTVTPTMTPVYYEVLEGDDFYSIGWRFNVSPQQIMTANPTVNPRAMSVGTSLLIPITPAPNPTATPLVELTPTATPFFADIQPPDCYPDPLGGLWCFVLITNNSSESVENVAGVVTIRFGEEVRRESAIMPLNLLPAGSALPLIAYFQPPLPEDYTITARVDFLLPVMPDDQRYLSVSIEDQTLELSADGRLAMVSGAVSLPAGQPEARYAWVNATAFDANGHVVAVRRWDGPEPLSGGTELPFTLYLYSLGGPIDRVDLMVEAPAEIELPNED
jgi:LysM repeat protein